MTSQSLFDWSRLNEWAKAKAHEEEVGISCTSNMCPVSNFLSETTGARWSVSLSIATEGMLNALPVPDWVKSLIEKVDAVACGQPTIIVREHFLDLLWLANPKRLVSDIASNNVGQSQWKYEQSLEEIQPAKEKRKQGFAVIDPEKKREIASMGGKSSHGGGRKRNEWSSEEASIMGAKGREARAKRKQEQGHEQ